MTTNSSIVTFLDDLASERPTPGGGGAAVVCGAIGAALVSMVANLTIGKKNYEAVWEDLEAVNAKAEALRAELTGAIEEDAVAFNSVMGGYGLPRATYEEKAKRSASIQAALKDATLAPLRAVKACFCGKHTQQTTVPRSRLPARQLMETACCNYEPVSRRIEPGLGFAAREPPGDSKMRRRDRPPKPRQ